VEYRHSVPRCVGQGLFGTVWLLGSVLLIVVVITWVAGRPSTALSAVPLFCVAVGAAYLGFVGTRSVLIARLTVTGDGLVCRESSYSLRVRTTTIPWSQVTSFTVKTGASRSSDRYFVSAILTTGQQVHLAATGRARRAAAVKIANELNAFASTTAATR
jgi:hypothetical protein